MSAPTRLAADDRTVLTLAEEFGLEPHEVRASLDLGDAGDDRTPLQDLGISPREAYEVLSLMAEQAESTNPREDIDMANTTMAEAQAPTYAPRSGDYCGMIGDGLVEHFRCDEHADGTVTSVKGGALIVREAPEGSPKGFDR